MYSTIEPVRGPADTVYSERDGFRLARMGPSALDAFVRISRSDGFFGGIDAGTAAAIVLEETIIAMMPINLYFTVILYP